MDPAQKTRTTMGVTVGAMLLILAIFLVIAWVLGDPTNNLGEHQPTPSPSPTSTS